MTDFPELELDDLDEKQDVEQEVEEVQEEELIQEEEVPQEEDLTLAKALFDEFTQRGYVTETDDNKFDGSFEWIDKQLEELPDKIQNSILAQIPDEGKSIVDFVLSAGPNLTREKLESFVKDFLNEDVVTLDTLDDAREFLTKVYQEKGFKKGAIEAQLNDLEDEDTLLEEAKKELGLQQTKIQKRIEEEKAQTKEQIKAQKEYEQAVLDNIKSLPEGRVQPVKQMVNQIQNVISEIVNDPVTYVKFLDVMSLYNPKTKTFDLSAFEKQATSKATSALKTAIKHALVNTGNKNDNPAQQSKLDEYEIEL